jgi:hypothetical protein
MASFAVKRRPPQSALTRSTDGSRVGWSTGTSSTRGATLEGRRGHWARCQKFASNTRKELETLLERHYLTLNQQTAALESEFRGVQDLESLKSEKRIVESELSKIGSALAEAQTAIADLRPNL